MKKFSKFVGQCLVVGSLAVSTVFAKSSVTDEQVYQLLDKSGATRTIESLPMQMQAMGQQMAMTAKDQQSHQAFMQVFLSSMNTETMIEHMAAHIKKEVQAEDLHSMLTWLETDLALRMVSAELTAAEPDFQQKFMGFMAQLQSNPPTPERTQTVIQYVESAKIVDQAMNVMSAMMQNMFAAVKAQDPENAALASMLDSQFEQMTTSMRPALEQQMIMTSYYIYRDINDADLNQYGNFFQQELGQKYMSLVVGAMGVALNNWGVTLMEQAIALKS